MSNSQRRWFRLEWLARIQELADLDTQKRAWLNAHPRTGNPHFSFVEYATTYENFANWPDRVSEGLISPEEAEAVTHLDKLVLDYHLPAATTSITKPYLSTSAGWKSFAPPEKHRNVSEL